MRKGKIIEAWAIPNIMGIYHGHGSVKCRHCMSEEDWKNLTHKQIITEEALRKDDEWIYCDYCEERL